MRSNPPDRPIRLGDQLGFLAHAGAAFERGGDAEFEPGAQERHPPRGPALGSRNEGQPDRAGVARALPANSGGR